MVQVDVGHQDVCHLARFDAEAGQPGLQGRVSRGRPGFDHGYAARPAQDIAGNDGWEALEVEVDQVVHAVDAPWLWT